MRASPLITLTLLTLLSSPLAAQQVPSPLAFATDAEQAALVGETAFVANRLIVRLESAGDMATAQALIDSQRWVVSEPLMPSIGLFLVAVLDGSPVAEAIVELSARAGVRYAAPDHVVTSRATTPNDASFGQQWAHTKMQSTLAWDLGQGSEQFVVSVVDGGCKLNHADLSSNLYVNAAEAAGTPGVDDDGNGYIDDVNGWNAYNNNGSIPNDGHGTHVNGIAGAQGNNGIGVVGVNWDVALMPVAGSSGSTSTVMKAYNYVLDQKQYWLDTAGAQGANVVSTNSSFGINYANCSSSAYKPWNDAYDAMGAVGILSCAATMNINANVDQTGDVPTGCSSDYMVALTNTTSADVKNSGAAYGLTMIDLGAPGTGIYSTYSNGGYTNMTGTSMASPQAAGAIAFMHSVASQDLSDLRDVDPASAATVVKDLLLENVDSLPSLEGKTVSGGRLNLFLAGQAISVWSNGPTAWVNLGGGLAGTLGTSTLSGSGTLAGGTTAGLNLSGASRGEAASLVLGLAQLNVPFKGGTLVPQPDVIIDGLVTDSNGNLALSGTWPNGVPAGVATYFQFWVSDTGGPQGLSASNGVSGTTP